MVADAHAIVAYRFEPDILCDVLPVANENRAAIRKAEQRVTLAVTLGKHAEQTSVTQKRRGFDGGCRRVPTAEQWRGNDRRRPAIRRGGWRKRRGSGTENAPAPMRQHHRERKPGERSRNTRGRT